MEDVRFFLLSGLSGAGKTVALRSLEEAGFFCVDNLPPSLLGKLGELVIRAEGRIRNVAVVIDARGRGLLAAWKEGHADLLRLGIRPMILFFEASDEVLVRRYKETRRRHPIADEGSLLDAVRRERAILEELRAKADLVFDTTHLRPEELREILFRHALRAERSRVQVHVITFGFKYGLPLDADLVFDVRFLRNPHYVPGLRPLTGCDPKVREYVLADPDASEFVSRVEDLLRFLLPRYEREGKPEVVIAVGCTGGRHRSVAIAEELAARLSDTYEVRQFHRDIRREEGERAERSSACAPPE
ncbi:MAG: putative P-loop-containing kinase [Brockia lithotrophica]|uniref:Putative P-loop-containing kinase n=1 Tax=Brockia lithotrophica TaxID=933949 RepID=A0A2T5G404_9BACL|nr:RNase adapter RapZ [Brockia lithotrophica]PTQ50916.1 MAG: putative P-loop-containing kinase [Brockia lithotrophica]